MTVCLKCGAENPATRRYCLRCEMALPHTGVGETLLGGPLQPPAAATLEAENVSPLAAPAASAAGACSHPTLFGVAPGPKAVASPPTPAQTLFGVSPPVPAAPHPLGAPSAPAASPRTLFGGAAARPVEAARMGEAAAPQRTLLGVIPEDVARAIEAARAASPRAAPPSRPPERPLGPGNTAAAFEPVRNLPTWIGTAEAAAPVLAAGPAAGVMEDGTVPSVALPATNEAVANTAPDPASALPSPTDAELAPPAPALHARTQLGVAIPGIAPLRAGLAAAGGPAHAPAPAETALEAPPPSIDLVPPRVQMPRSALVLLSSGLVLLASAAAFALLWTGTKPLSAALSSDPSGKERIDLVCTDCPDGTILHLGDARTEVRDRKAYLVPQEPLALGENTLRFGLQRPGEADTETVEVKLPPIEYRIRPDTSSLAEEPARLSLDLETLPGTRAQLGDAPVPLDAQGRGRAQIDVSGQLLGQSGDIATFEQSVPYAITAPSGKHYRGELRVKIGVTPLLLSAPGTDSITEMDRFMLAGRTTKGAEVSVAGSSVPVDESGRFAQLMSIDSVGETKVTVRAAHPGLAPRFAVFRLERVKSLEAVVAAQRQRALPLATVAADVAAHVGSTVLVRGKVEEVRMDGHRALLLLSADKDCTRRECLARLLYGGLRKIERGSSVIAIGRVQGSAPGAPSVPEIEVSLLL